MNTHEETVHDELCTVATWAIPMLRPRTATLSSVQRLSPIACSHRSTVLQENSAYTVINGIKTVATERVASFLIRSLYLYLVCCYASYQCLYALRHCCHVPSVGVVEQFEVCYSILWTR